MSRIFITSCKKSQSKLFQNSGFLSVVSKCMVLSDRKFAGFANTPKISRRKFTRKFKNQTRCLSEKIISSPLGEGKEIPNETIPDYIFSKMDDTNIELPAATCAVTGRSYSYGMMNMLVDRFAQAVLGHCNLKPKEVIGLLLPNIPEFVIVCHGALKAGLVVTFVNPLYTPDEIKRQFENANVKMIVTVQQLMEAATIVGSKLENYKGTICIGGEDDIAKKIYGLESLLRAGHEADLPEVEPKQLALLPYSSGTTGLPKGVMLTHRNIVANMVQNDHEDIILEENFDENNKENESDAKGAQMKIFTVLPFFHIYGFNVILNLSLRMKYHVITMPRFSPEDYLKALVAYRPRTLFVVPSLITFLASHPSVQPAHLSSIKYIQSGAAPLSEGLEQRFKQKFGSHIEIRQGYGMTESSPVTFCMTKSTLPSKHGTIGVPIPKTEAKIVDLSTGEPLGPNKPGELWVRGPQVMTGYLNNQKATEETLDKEGWLHTGDVTYYDDDKYFYIIDRCKELIKVKGNQVSPTELENLLLEIPGIVDAAVIGIPDALAEEVPKAFVVKKPEANITDKDILKYVNARVAHYKKLVGGVLFLDSIPRNPSGKILRNELRIL